MRVLDAIAAGAIGVLGFVACASAGDGTGALGEPASMTQAGVGGGAGVMGGAGGAAGSAGASVAGSGGAAGGTSGTSGGTSGAGATPVPTEPLDPDDPLLGGGAPMPDRAGCGKIDFLFVVDNSGSMTDEQQNLIDSFPGFIRTIQDAVAASDHHVLVIDTDASGGGTSMNTTCSGDTCTCGPAAECCDAICATRPSGTCNGSPCNNLPEPDPTSCDTTLGAGKVYRFDGTRCIPDSPRYMTQSDPALAENFACVANVGTAGDGNEMPMQAIAQALGPMSEPGQCNEGFLRDDAILVVTFITDEEEEPGKSPGDPADWAANLVAVKNGNQEAIVVLGVFGDNDRPDGTCPPGGLMDEEGADPGYRLRELVESFRYGVVGSVCAPDYAPFFTDAVSVIDGACDAFTL